MSTAALSNIQLTRGFTTTPSDEKMSKSELIVRSAVALTLGSLPFLISMISLQGLKAFVYLGSLTPHYPLLGKGVRFISGIPGVLAASMMFLFIKFFSLSQKPSWKNYVEHPVEDRANTRLAWYGAQDRLWKDLKSVAKAFYSPDHLEESEWTLLEWSQLRI